MDQESTFEDLIAFCNENERVCPMPMIWNDLWNMLPSNMRVGAGWEPPLPLILGAWHHASETEKANRLRVHIEWAKKHDRLEEISSFLRDLDETDWFHKGDQT